MDELAKASNRFVGSEIESAIIDALYIGYSDGCRDIDTSDILASLERLIPLAESQKTVITELRKWLSEGRAISASFRGKAEALKKATSLEMPDIMLEI